MGYIDRKDYEIAVVVKLVVGKKCVLPTKNIFVKIRDRLLYCILLYV